MVDFLDEFNEEFGLFLSVLVLRDWGFLVI